VVSLLFFHFVPPLFCISILKITKTHLLYLFSLTLLTLVICEDDILAQSLKEDSRIDNEGDEEFSFDNKIPDDKVSVAKTEDSNVQGTDRVAYEKS
jgi:hypothetical protein